MMKRTFFLSFLILYAIAGFSQDFDQHVDNIIVAINQDSLIKQMRNLSGEDPVMINGELQTIEHRVSNWGNNLSAQYLFETLDSYGLESEMQTYSMGGINVIAIQTGTVYPDEYYMICAHYDAVDYYCADDNASGTAAVLEAARIFSELDFEYSLIYALWDEEEIGLIGSNEYATEAATNGDIIHGVINMDMISWDGDGDHVAEIHTSFDAESNLLADYMYNINSLYGIDLTANIMNPGVPYSDHKSFWDAGFKSIMLSEEYFGGDFNPYYHTEEDRIDILDMDYFYEMSKLTIGTVAQLSTLDVNVGTEELNSNASLAIFPNPARYSTHITCQLEQSKYAQITLLNNMGQLISVLHQGEIPAENYQVNLPLNNLSRGIYFVKIESDQGMSTEKLMVN